MRGKAVEIAGGETAETAVSEARVGLHFIYFIQLYVKAGKSLSDRLGYSQIKETVFKRAAHKKFHTEIVDLLGILLLGLFDKFVAVFLQECP